ncbi:hypothetical protein JKP88DRAFT_276630 [Tribonema minus]|uniref:Fatty acid hydroxylase domain-containing protein n=1 Tax=Tribonema minus TaxID=303371 RepID=A0A836CGI7_9STRA|nr:hypothetical protein JKP88DRAFT_276630 [Tribonema minus]
MTVGIGLGVALSWSSGEMQRRGARLVLDSAAEALKCSLEASPLFAALSWLLKQDSLPLSTYQDIRERSFAYWICSVLLWFIIFDLLMYLQHRLTHSTRFLYDSVHYHHHKLRPLVTPVVLVFGAVDMALMALAAIAPTSIITMHWGTIFLCVAAIILYSFLTHNLDMDFMAGSRWMVSSRSHGKHHQYGMDACNYGVITNCWDLLFGTYREP